MKELHSIEVLQFRSNCIISFVEVLKKSTNSHLYINNQIVKSNETYTGNLTKFSRKNLSRALEIIYLTTPFRYCFNNALNVFVNFKLSHLTLTLSGTNDLWTYKDYTAKLLSPFLSDCKRKYGMTKYVWKAELQENGNIHYHIISDMFQNHSDIKNLWNYHQRKHGLIDGYYRNYGNYHPNSTDIHSVDCSGNVANYLLKYISKSSQNKVKLDGKVWDCSLNIKGKKYFTIKTGDNGFTEMSALRNFMLFETIERDRCIIYKPLNGSLSQCLPPSVLSLMRSYYSSFDV